MTNTDLINKLDKIGTAFLPFFRKCLRNFNWQLRLFTLSKKHLFFHNVLSGNVRQKSQDSGHD